jgi:hypothetical protein
VGAGQGETNNDFAGTGKFVCWRGAAMLPHTGILLSLFTQLEKYSLMSQQWVKRGRFFPKHASIYCSLLKPDG